MHARDETGDRVPGGTLHGYYMIKPGWVMLLDREPAQGETWKPFVNGRAGPAPVRWSAGRRRSGPLIDRCDDG